MRFHPSSSVILVLVGLAFAPSKADDLPSKAGETRFRRPTSLAVSADGSQLYVANRQSGSVSVLDLKSGLVVSEQDIGKGLSDLARLPDGRLVALDREAGELVVLKTAEVGVTVERRVAVAADPASLLLSPDGSRCVVASTGSHQISLVLLNADETKRSVRMIDLPFAPLRLAWAVPGSVVVAADAYGGKIGVIDLSKDHPDSVRSIPAHNIRGLAVTPDGRSLVLAHQTLSKLARSSFEDVHWGSLVGNHLRILSLEVLLKPDGDLLRGSKLIDLGRTGQAAGDPGAIVFDSSGKMILALSGVQEIGLMANSRSYAMKRIAVGSNPVALAISPDGSRVYVADAFGDAISVVDVRTGSRVKTWSLGPKPESSPTERGERLFFDAKLSHDGWMSCQSCHTDGRENGQLADTLTDGGFGAPKRVTSLLGVGATAPWGWLGTTSTLEDQVRRSIETTMRGRTPSQTDVEDLTAYLRSLPPPKAKAHLETEAIARGQALFQLRKCAGCHAPPEYTTEGRFDVGLIDEAGNRQFNPPSLRGIGDRPPYLHDGRAEQLPDVFLKHRHPRDSAWSDAEVADLVAFLRTL